MAVLGFNFDLVEQLAFYGAYHSNRWNQLIHFVFVPAIFFTVAVWLAYTPALVPWDAAAALRPALGPTLADACVLNWSAVGVGAYVAYYLCLDFFAGLSWAACMGAPMWVGANMWQQHGQQAWAWALGLHVLSWLVQVLVGHSMLEKRRPSLLDSFFQSLVLAPLFVWYELLFLLGYRPELHAELQRRVAVDVAAYKAASAPLLADGQGASGASDGAGNGNGVAANGKHK